MIFETGVIVVAIAIGNLLCSVFLYTYYNI